MQRKFCKGIVLDAKGRKYVNRNNDYLSVRKRKDNAWKIQDMKMMVLRI